ncbi:MAG: GGDEF domain-containing protein [Pseudomonadota bacterium]
MTLNNPSEMTCPVGQPQCPFLDEVAGLRTQCATMNEAIHTDALTGLYNFRHFQETLTLELERTHRTGMPTSLMMIDLDYFKRVNDTWGHETGNLVLKHLACLVRMEIRRLDIPCRYGGEEFAIIVPGAPLVKAIRMAERLRMRIESSPLERVEGSLVFTASFGVDCYLGSGPPHPEGFIQQTDAWLYKAKREGRNRVGHPDLRLPEPVSAVSDDEKRMLIYS